MKSLPGLCAVILLLSAQAAVAQTQRVEPFGVSGLRIAFFSPQRAFSESDDGKAGLARLKALQEKRSREVETRNRALGEREEALKQALGILSADGRDQRTREVEKLRLDVQRFIEDAQAEFLSVQREIQTAFLVRVRPVIEQMVKDRRLDIVLNADAETLLWGDASVEITADVIKQLAANAAKPGL